MRIKKLLFINLLCIIGLLGCGGGSSPSGCPEGQQEEDGVCVDIPLDCPDGYYEENDVCVQNPLVCSEGQHVENNSCVPDTPTCDDGEEVINNQCVSTASDTTLVDSSDNDDADPASSISDTESGPQLNTNLSDEMAPDYQQSLSSQSPE